MPQSPFIDIVNGRPVIDPGKMRDQVNLVQQTALVPTQTDAGGVKKGLTTVISGARAAISLYRGKEQFAAGQTSAEAYMIIAMWYQPGVLPSQLVQARNGTYKIMAIENVLEMNLVLELVCIAVGANQ